MSQFQPEKDRQNDVAISVVISLTDVTPSEQAHNRPMAYRQSTEEASGSIDLLKHRIVLNFPKIMGLFERDKSDLKSLREACDLI